MKVTILAGGVGAAKFAVGLAAVMPPEDLTIISNTGDDIELFGLRVSPDVDTMIYTLAGVINEATGWGLADDTFECLGWLGRYVGPLWFNLGDRDLATHIYRADVLRRGLTLSEVTDDIRRALGVRARVLPMTDAYTPTRVLTDEGELHFQEYFVRRRCEPRVRGLRFENIESARPAAGVLAAILETDAVIVCPSNPFISIGPVLAVPGVREALRRTPAPVAAISPVVAGRALKGPTADMLRDLGHDVSALGVARLYSDFIDWFVLDRADAALAAEVEALGLRAMVTDTVMQSAEDKQRLARSMLASLQAELHS